MKVGARFKNRCFEYMLASSYSNRVMCVCLATATVFDDKRAITVDNPYDITKEEFETITGVKHTDFTDMEGKPLFPETTYAIGDKFVFNGPGPFNGNCHILCSADGISISLIDIKTGERWTSPVRIKSISNLDETEVLETMGNYPDDFVKV